MTASAAAPWEWRLRQLLPMSTIALAGLLDLAPLPASVPSGAAPDLMMATVFFWALHRPQLVPVGGLFGVALVRDLVAGSLIGLTPSVLLVMREVLVRRHKLLLAGSALTLWAGFASYAVAIGALRWVVATLYLAHPHDPMPSVMEAILTVLAWPLVALILTRVDAMLPRTRHAAGG